MNPLNFPEIIHIENTNYCVAECLMCPRKKMTRTKGLMQFDIFEKIIRECMNYTSEIKQLHLHGFGEPLIDKFLPEKVYFAKKNGIEFTYLVTTGSLLNNTLARNLILSGLDCIKFSYYGASKVTYESVHRGLNFEDVTNCIQTFINIREKLNSPTPRVRFQIAPSLVTKNEFKAILKRWLPFMNGEKGDMFTVTGLHNWAGGNIVNNIKTPEKERDCHLPFKEIQILWDGRVTSCVFDYDSRNVLGNVNTDKIKDVWLGHAYSAFRQAWQKKQFNRKSICMFCDKTDNIFQPKTISIEAAMSIIESN